MLSDIMVTSDFPAACSPLLDGRRIQRRANDRVSLAIVDAQPIFRTGLRTLLDSSNEYDVVGEGDDSGDALVLVRERAPDVLLLDYTTQAEVLDVLRAIAAAHLRVRTILLSGQTLPTAAIEPLRLGAAGILRKSATKDQLLRCISTVVRGGCWVDRKTTADLVAALRERGNGSENKRLTDISCADRKILVGLRGGASNKEIARALGIAEQTVKNRLSGLYERFSVRNRLELTLKIGQLKSIPEIDA
jgi:DNA-binding NarL/FixJ family response regulator